MRHFFLPNCKDLAPNFFTDDGYVFFYLPSLSHFFKKVQLRRSRMARQYDQTTQISSKYHVSKLSLVLVPFLFLVLFSGIYCLHTFV